MYRYQKYVSLLSYTRTCTRYSTCLVSASKRTRTSNMSLYSQQRNMCQITEHVQEPFSRDLSLCKTAVEPVPETFLCVRQQWDMYQRHVLVSFASGTCSRDILLHKAQQAVEHVSSTCSSADYTRQYLWNMFHCWPYKDISPVLVPLVTVTRTVSGTCFTGDCHTDCLWNMFHWWLSHGLSLVHVPLVTVTRTVSGTCSIGNCHTDCLWYMFHWWLLSRTNLINGFFSGQLHD